MRKRKYVIVILCLTALLMTVSGCFSMTADELYSLPQASKEYIELQEQINTVLAAGAEYSPPMSGTNRQSVQMKDIDRDGQNEAIIFFRTTEDKPLKIYIMKPTNGTYETISKIEGDGTAIESIRYADMDGDGVSEFIVGWQMSAALLHMSIYSIKDGESILRTSSDYTKLVVDDIDGDGHVDVIALRLPTAELPGEAEMFSLQPDGEVIPRTAQLSKGIESIARAMRGKLSDGKPAIFVECGYGGSVLTDVLTWRYNGLFNISVSPYSGVSEDTLRGAYSNSIYCTDINNDGVMEIPSPELLVSPSDTKYYDIDWYSLDRLGNRNKVFTTYHNFSDGWYLILPDDWKDNISVRREDAVAGERTMIFSFVTEDEETPVDFLRIYTLSGDNKEDRAKGRFIFPLERGDTIYAYDILTKSVGITVGETLIKDSFRLHYSEWNTGGL